MLCMLIASKVTRLKGMGRKGPWLMVKPVDEVARGSGSGCVLPSIALVSF